MFFAVTSRSLRLIILNLSTNPQVMDKADYHYELARSDLP